MKRIQFRIKNNKTIIQVRLNSINNIIAEDSVFIRFYICDWYCCVDYMNLI